MGESAGGLSAMYLMASPLADGLFHKAILQSAYMINTPALRQPVHGLPAAEQVGTYLQGALKAADIAAMRAMDARELTAARSGGWLCNRSGLSMAGRSSGNWSIRLTGANRRGFRCWRDSTAGRSVSLRVLAAPTPSSAAAYEAAITCRYGDLAPLYLRLYPSSDTGESILAATRDALYGWTAERLVRKQTEVGAPSFLYVFDHGYPAADALGLHAFHAAELPYVFGTMDDVPLYWPRSPDSKQENALSVAMIDYWTSFARDGAPRASGAAEWAAYGAERNFVAFVGEPKAGA
jgi:para-nitrobenzyl esterase